MSLFIKFINNSLYKKKQSKSTKCIQELEFAFGYHFATQSYLVYEMVGMTR